MKNQKHKDKICGICKLGIDESKEFAKLTHYVNKDKILTEGYYHIICFQNKMGSSENLNKLQAMASQLLLRANEKIEGF
jgi:hypothetical protein